MSKGRRAGEAPHELFGSTLIMSLSLVGDGCWDACRVLGCRYELPRKSVGSLRDGHGVGNSRVARTTATSVVTNIDVSPSGICELVNGHRPITADTALRLGMFFGMEPRFWLNLQSEYDVRVADRELRAKLAPRIRGYQPIQA
jgi:antitoxin HigA-1